MVAIRAQVYDDSKLSDALDKSSAINRTVGLVFASFVIYVIITLLGVTDLALLLPDYKLNMPLIDLKMSLTMFSIIVPLLLLGLHGNLLVNLLAHSKKLSAWRYQARQNGDPHMLRLHPFIFNLRASQKTNTLTYGIANFLVQSIVFFIPPLMLLVIQVRFSDYQSLLITHFHFVLLLSDVFLLLLYRGIILKEYNHTEPYFIEDMIFQTLTGNRLLFGFVFLLLAYSIDNIVAVYRVTFSDDAEIFDSRINAVRHIPRITVSDAEFIEVNSMMDHLHESETSGGLSEQASDLVRSRVLEGIDLSNRKLRYADLSNSILINSILDNADLSYSNMSGASLFGASLKGAFIEGVVWDNVDLSNADLSGCHFNDCSLDRVSFKKASGMNFRISNSSLEFIDFTDASLEQFSLLGSNLHHVDLEGMGFENSVILSSVVTYSEFDNLDLSNAMVAGCLISHSAPSSVLLNLQQQNENLVMQKSAGKPISNAVFAEKLLNGKQVALCLDEERLIFPENLLVDQEYSILMDSSGQESVNDSLYKMICANRAGKWRKFVKDEELVGSFLFSEESTKQKRFWWPTAILVTQPFLRLQLELDKLFGKPTCRE